MTLQQSCDDTPSPGITDENAPVKHRRRDVWLGAVLVLVVYCLMSHAWYWHSPVILGIGDNVQIGEAQAWWEGRLNLLERRFDTALKDGLVYSYFPPMFTLVAAVFVPFYSGVPQWVILLMVGAVPVLSYLVFYRRTHSPILAVLMGIAYVCGTSALPVLDRTIISGLPYHINHTLASLGVLLILFDYFGHQRVWPAAIGLCVAAWSRQLTVLYAIPIIYMAYTGGDIPQRLRRCALAIGTCVLVVGLYATLNMLKFGHPLTTGYQLNHEGRVDTLAVEARAHGILSTHWLPRNLYHMNLGFPNLLVHDSGKRRACLHSNDLGTGVLWTSPILIWLVVSAGSLWKDRSTLVLLLATASVYVLLMFWHATGSNQHGYNRYSLDFLPALLALIAPYCFVGWRRWVSYGMIAWSVLYFGILIWQPHIPIWSILIAQT